MLGPGCGRGRGPSISLGGGRKGSSGPAPQCFACRLVPWSLRCLGTRGPERVGGAARSPLLSQVLWTFSIYLEAVAILPQLILLQRTSNIDTLTGNYVFLLG